MQRAVGTSTRGTSGSRVGSARGPNGPWGNAHGGEPRPRRPPPGRHRAPRSRRTEARAWLPAGRGGRGPSAPQGQPEHVASHEVKRGELGGSSDQLAVERPPEAVLVLDA